MVGITFMVFITFMGDTDSYNLGENSIDRFLNEVDTKKLSDEEKMTLDKQLTRSELYEALKIFPKNKTPGSDGLTGILLGVLARGCKVSRKVSKLLSPTRATINFAKAGNDYPIGEKR